MALKFSEMVARLSADERKLLDNTFAKYPELKDDWKSVEEDGLRQADYSRKMNEWKAKETEYVELQTYKEKQAPWAETAYERIHAMEEAGVLDADGTVLWTTQKADLEKQLDEARKAAVGGADMDPAELDKRVREIVKQNGGLTKEELNAVIISEGKKLVAEGFKEEWSKKETSFNENTIPFVTSFATSASIVANRYEKETGEKWTLDKQKELYAMMSADKNFDAFSFEERLLGPHREKKTREAEIQAEVDKRVKAQRGMPGGGEEGFIPQPQEKGALQKMLEQSASDGDFEAKIRAGAVQAAKELQAEGKG